MSRRVLQLKHLRGRHTSLVCGPEGVTFKSARKSHVEANTAVLRDSRRSNGTACWLSQLTQCKDGKTSFFSASPVCR